MDKRKKPNAMIIPANTLKVGDTITITGNGVMGTPPPSKKRRALAEAGEGR